MNKRAWKEIVVTVFGFLFVLSGIAGITLGGTSAQAGWWLVIVGILMGLVGLMTLRTRAAGHD